jgi:hypothetical protein
LLSARAAENSAQRRAQEPGPSALPQVLQGPGNSDRPAPELAGAAKAESFLVSSVAWQLGHSTAGEEDRTRVSNSLPQRSQRYSKMGIACSDIRRRD